MGSGRSGRVRGRRRGSYRLARLAVRYGPDMEMDRLLAHLAGDCPWWRTNPRKYDPACAARYTDLDRASLPDLPADVGTDVLRQRIPPREAVPQRRRTDPSPVWSTPMLSATRSPTLVLACRTCGRRDEQAVATLLAEHGDMRMTDLRHGLTADCPRRDAAEQRDRCNTEFEGFLSDNRNRR